MPVSDDTSISVHHGPADGPGHPALLAPHGPAGTGRNLGTYFDYLDALNGGVLPTSALLTKDRFKTLSGS